VGRSPPTLHPWIQPIMCIFLALHIKTQSISKIFTNKRGCRCGPLNLPLPFVTCITPLVFKHKFVSSNCPLKILYKIVSNPI
jgi:hypothetical protein